MLTNNVLIICTTFNFPRELSKALTSILNVLNHRSDTICTIIDNFSKDEVVHKLLDQTTHPKLTIIKNGVNHGKAIATNNYISTSINHLNCPRIVISMDPDMVFAPDSVDQLIDALDNIPRLGMLAMRYIPNECNPERSMWMPPKSLTGVNEKKYQVRCPVFANVPGGFFGIQGYVLSHYLGFKLFPKSKNETNINQGFVVRAGSDDAFLYDNLKKHRLIQGYLEGTQIEHLKAPPQRKNYIK